MNLSSYSQEDIDRAKKRGRAYLCTACYHKSDRQTRKIDEKGRLEDHILKTHVAPERWPFFCTLCLFRCTRREQLTHHVDNYQRHLDMASARQIKNSFPWLVESPNPYKISELDYAKLSQEESLQFYLQRHGAKLDKGNASSNAINSALRRMSEGTLVDDIAQELLQAGFIDDSLAVGDNEQDDQQLNWAGSIDSTIISPSWTSGSASMVVSPVASTISSQLCTGLPGSVTTSAPATVDTVRPETSEVNATSIPQVTTVVVQLPLARIQESPATSVPPVASMQPLTSKSGLPATLATTVSSTACVPQGTTASSATQVMTMVESQPLTGILWAKDMSVSQVVTTIGSEPWIWVPGSTAKTVPQSASTSGLQPCAGTSGPTVVAIPPVTTAVGLQPQLGTKGTAVSPVIPVTSTVGVQPWTTVPGTTTTSALQIAHTSKTQPGTVTMVTMTKPIASASQSTVPLVSQSQPPAVDAGPLDLSLQQPLASGDDTASNMDAMDHQPEPLEPLTSDSSGVQLGESVESEFEDILPQLLEREATDLTSNEVDIGENGTDNTDNTDEPTRKRQRTGVEKDDEPVFNLNMVALNGLTESLQKVKNQMGLREKASERTGKSLVEAICEMGKSWAR